MFYLNNNDMEHWFKEAAEKFEPDLQGAADWPRIQAALHNEPSSKDIALPIEEEKNKRRRFVFWWFFLLPAAGILYYGITKFSAEQKPATNIVNNTKASQAQPGSVTAGNNNASAKTTPEHNSNGNSNSNTAILPQQGNATESKQTINGNKNKNGASGKNPFTLQHLDAFKRNVDAIKKESATFSSNNAVVENKQSETKPSNTEVNDGSNLTDQNKINSGKAVEKNNDVTKEANAESGKTISAVTTEKQTTSDNNLLKPKDSATASAVNKISPQKTKYFYAGLIFGADESFIKGQRTNGLGSSVGILLGYSFNKRLRIETGVALDTKKYYTTGKYFDKSNIWYLQNANLLAVDGSCHMFEIPVNIRYDLYQGKKITWFAAAGASSYLMHKEYYDYKFMYGGVYGEKDYSYYNSSRNWFSVMNISGGLETRLGNAGDLRVEPYMRVPISGVGKGNISLSSAGLYIGLTRHFK